jgi:hypothetical protein
VISPANRFHEGGGAAEYCGRECAALSAFLELPDSRAKALEKFCRKVDQRDLRLVGFWVIAFLHCGRSNLGPVLAYEKYAPGVVKKGLTRRLS